MPTSDQRDAVRYDLNTTSTAMPDAEIDILYTRAESRYGAGTESTESYVRIIAIRRLLAGASKLADYKQNQSEEKLSQIKAGLRDLLKDYQAELELLVNGSTAAVRFGGLRRYNPRYVEYPSDWDFPSANDNDVSRLDE